MNLDEEMRQLRALRQALDMLPQGAYFQLQQREPGGLTIQVAADVNAAVAAEREACALLCDDRASMAVIDSIGLAADGLARRIRART